MKKQSQVVSQSLHSALLGFLSIAMFTLTLFLLPTLAHSAQVTLAWDPNTEPDLAGYKVYYKEVSSGPPYNGTGATEGDSPIDVGNVTEFTLNGLSDNNTYFFVVTAYDDEGLESDFSNEVSTLSVTSITSSTDDGSYKAGDTVNITINFSEAVTLGGGNLIVTLDTGGTITIDSISSQTSVSVIYTVQDGDETSDLNVESLELSEGATLKNNESHDCNLSLPTGSNLADNGDIIVDTTAPSSSVTTAPAYGNGALSVEWTASDGSSGSGVASIELWFKKGSSGTWANTGLAAQTGTGGTFSYTPSNGDGTYYLATRSIDNAGNTEAVPSGNGDDSTVYDTTPPNAPIVAGTTPTNDTTPTWSWSSGGGGNGTYRYKLDNSDLSSGAIQTISTSYTPDSALSEGSHILYIQERDAAGNWSSSGSFTAVIDITAPYIQHYPIIDLGNNTFSVTYSMNNMQNVTEEANYSFHPSLNFATGSDDIINTSGSTYRLAMASIPAYTIYTLTVNNITDAAGNPVLPSSIRINDNDNDDMPDDWEIAYEVDDPHGDPDLDDLNNVEEYTNNTNPNNSDTDGDSLPDAFEVTYGLDPNDSTGINGGDGDFDDDGWSNYEEHVNGTNPVDNTSLPALTPPEIIEAIPNNNTGISDDTRVPNITSFFVRIEDADGIDVTDTGSIVFTISDGINETYTRDLSDTTVVRVVKLAEGEDTSVTNLWAVYDRSMEDEFGNYDYDSQINIRIDVKDRRGCPIDPAPSYDFKIESQTEHNEAHDPDNLPDTGEIASDDPDLEDPEYSYDAGTQVISGDLYGAKIVYDSNEPVKPTFGPTDEIPSLNGDEDGVPMNLQPPTVFNTPVKIFIPYPGATDVSDLSIFVYKGSSWVLACDASGNVQPGGIGWIVPGSRVDHNNGNPSTIEIKVYHFSAIWAGISTDDDSSPPSTPTEGDDIDMDITVGGGCFIATAAFGSNMDSQVEILRQFRDVYLLPTKLGHTFVDVYYRYSPPIAGFISTHESVRAAVRIGLMPLVGMSYLALHTTQAQKVLILLCMLLGVYISKDLKIYPPEVRRINVKFYKPIWVQGIPRYWILVT